MSVARTVEITLTYDQFLTLQMALGFATGASLRDPEGGDLFRQIVRLVNTISETTVVHGT
jgi:hypothetical protein